MTNKYQDFSFLREELLDKLNVVCPETKGPGLGERLRYSAQCLQFMFELGWKSAGGTGEPPNLLIAKPCGVLITLEHLDREPDQWACRKARPCPDHPAPTIHSIHDH
jgi:hypothetical protein